MQIKSSKFLNIFLAISLMLFPFENIYSMQSTNYIIDKDSINFGGSEESTSASYKLSDTMGEIGTGESEEKCSSMSFDGMNDYINCGNDSSLDITGPITLEAWIKPSVGTGQQGIIGTYGFDNAYSLYLRHSAGGDIGFQYTTSAGTRYYLMKGTLDYGAWNHVVGTWDGSTMKIYINNALFTGQSSTATTRLFEGVKIGYTEHIASPVYYNGLIEDVRIYSRALSADEVSDLYNGNQVDDTGLVGYWSFDEAALGTDLVTNGDFESGFTDGLASGWSKAGTETFSQETSIARNSSAQRILSTNNAEIYQAIPIVAGKPYRFTSWVYVASALNYNPRMYLVTDNVTIASGDKSLVGEWQKIEADYTPVNSGNLTFYVGMLASGATGDYIVDDVSVKEIREEDKSSNTNDGTISGATFSSDTPDATCSILNAGYRQDDTFISTISISSPDDVILGPSFGGILGGTGTGSADWTVTTDDPAGYQVSIKATTTPALIFSAYSFADYMPGAGTPDYDWTVTSSASEFGYSVEGTHTVSKFLDNGTACDTGSGNVTDKCWLGFSTSDESVATSSSPNDPTGTATTIKFRAEAGNQRMQQDGTYVATIVVTAVAL